MRMPAARSSRSGLSLLEVIASLAIFLLALAGITQLMSTSTQAARRIQFQSQATLLCQSKLADFCAGVEPLDAGGGGDFEDDSGWKWSADSAAESTPGLYRVTVKVFKESSTGEVQFETSLSQFILSPATRGNLSATANQPADPSTNSSSSPSGSSSSSSGSSSSSTTPAASKSTPTSSGSTPSSSNPITK